MNLDEKALEAAWDTLPKGSTLISRKAFRCAIRAYLTALPSSPVSDLVERLREAHAAREHAEQVRDELFELVEDYRKRELNADAAFILTSLSTRNAELEREVKRLREVMQEIEDSTDLTTVNGHLYDRVIAALSTSPQGGEHE